MILRIFTWYGWRRSSRRLNACSPGIPHRFEPQAMLLRRSYLHRLCLMSCVRIAVTSAQSRSLCRRLRHRKRRTAGNGCPQSSVKLVAKDGEGQEIPLMQYFRGLICGCNNLVSILFMAHSTAVCWRINSKISPAACV